MFRSLKEDTLSVNPLFTTTEAKDFLKVDTTADDTLIDSLIKAATQSCQIFTNRYFLTTTVTQYSDKWDGIYTLYKSPVIGITHIKYFDSNDTEQTLASSNYILDNVSQPARIGIAVNGTLPDLADRINAVRVEYKVGYGITSNLVPEGIKQAVLITIGNWYENRQTVITGRTATELPLSSQYLLEQYKIQVC
tara:strand:+ start:2027 stop:2605 length:579 start_codon:yes stop_codon:yes gene_type:complete